MADELVIEGIVEVKQRDVQFLLEAGYLYMELNKWQEAEEVFQGVAALIPHSDVPHMALGHMWFAKGRFSQALKAHQKAIELNPEGAANHASAGETLMFMRKHDKALAALDKAIALDPEGAAGQFARSLKEAYELGVFG